jgi:transposase
MARPISNEKRADIVKHMKSGESKENIAKWLFVCVRTVTRVWNKFQEVGSYEPKPPNCGRKPLVSTETMGEILSKIEEQPDITLNELIDGFSLGITESALSKRLKKAGLTYKKRLSTRKSRSAQT